MHQSKKEIMQSKKKATISARRGVSKTEAREYSQAAATAAPLKKERILEDLRGRIVDGEWLPGAQLPTRVQLERQFDASTDTVQRALHRLIEDEFVYADGRRGTFVADNPPHLSRYALVFAADPQRKGIWTRFWTALGNEALRLRQSRTHHIAIYSGLDGHRDNPDYLKLAREIQAHRLAGLILVGDVTLPPHCDVPCIVLDHDCEEGMTCVNLDMNSFGDAALDFLQERGRKRVAVVTHKAADDPQNLHLQDGIAARGLTTQPYWMLSCSVEMPVAARNLVHLLMQPGQKQRPDALIITDDNLVEHATAGLLDASTRMPADVEVVAHCNFPWPTPSSVPARRLGYDAARVLEVCLDKIDRQRRGQSVRPITLMPALFEESVAHETPPRRAPTMRASTRTAALRQKEETTNYVQTR